jgi:hypothetical protein
MYMLYAFMTFSMSDDHFQLSLDPWNIIHMHVLFFIIICIIVCNPPLAPQCNYLRVHCAVSVIGFTAVDTAHK